MFESAFKEEFKDKQLADEYWAEIAEKHSAAGRFYHTLDHLDFLYTHLLPVRNRILDWQSMVFAVAYHDFEYDVMRSDNEERSADVAAKKLSSADFLPETVCSCTAHILATKGHIIASESDTNFFTDADLSIFGSQHSAYDYYVQEIRKEFGTFPDEIFNEGRAKVVRYFLGMDFIYKTQYFRDKYEERAKENLQRELNSLIK